MNIDLGNLAPGKARLVGVSLAGKPWKTRVLHHTASCGVLYHILLPAGSWASGSVGDIRAPGTHRWRERLSLVIRPRPLQRSTIPKHNLIHCQFRRRVCSLGILYHG